MGSAGATNGGATNGGASPKGGSTSVPEECFRPYVCADTCDGEKQNFGCQPCPDGLIDTLFCPDAGATTGLFGTVNFLEGDHQPTSGVSSGTTTHVARELRFYDPVPAASLDRDPARYYVLGIFATIRGVLRGKAYSGADGKYTVTLSPGKYSVFVKDEDDWYCNGGNADGKCVVEVPASGTLKHNIDIIWAAAF